MFTLLATLTDGCEVRLPYSYPSEAAASRAAETYMRDYSDPCGLGVSVYCVSIIRAAE